MEGKNEKILVLYWVLQVCLLSFVQNTFAVNNQLFLCMKQIAQWHTVQSMMNYLIMFK